KLEQAKLDGTLALEKQKQQAADKLDEKKFETTLILKAIDTPDREAQVKNLRFFVRAGFVADPGNKIEKMPLEDLPIQTSTSVSSADFTGIDPQLVDFLKSVSSSEKPDPSYIRLAQLQIPEIVHVPLNQNQTFALTSLIYSI